MTEDFLATISQELLAHVVDVWLAEHPGKTIDDMPSGEFADRCLKAMTVERLQKGNA